MQNDDTPPLGATRLPMSGDRDIEWEFDYRSGDQNIDIWFMDDLNFQQYENDNSFTYMGSLSAPDGKSASRGPIDPGPGSWHLVVDNTDTGDATPPTNGENDAVSFRLKVWLN